MTSADISPKVLSNAHLLTVKKLNHLFCYCPQSFLHFLWSDYSMQNWSIPPQSVSAGDSGESVQPSAPSTTQPPDQPPATAMSPSHPPPAKTMPTTVHPPATPLSGSTRPCPRPAWPACPRSPPAQPVHPSTKPHKHRRPSRPSTGELPCCRPLNLLCLSLRLSPRGKKV